MSDWTLNADITDAGMQPEVGIRLSIEPVVRHPIVSGNSVVYSPQRAKTSVGGTVSMQVPSVAGMVWKVKIEGDEVARIPDPGEGQSVDLVDWTLPAGPISVNASMALLRKINEIKRLVGDGTTPPTSGQPQITWNGTRLVVNGVDGPDLKGDKGDTPAITWEGTRIVVDGVSGPDLAAGTSAGGGIVATENPDGTITFAEGSGVAESDGVIIFS